MEITYIRQPTEEEVEKSAKWSATTERILGCLKSKGSATKEQLQQMTSYKLSTINAQVSILKRMGLIEDAGSTLRPTLIADQTVRAGEPSFGSGSELNVELVYKGKEAVNDILTNITPVPLTEIGRFGSTLLGDWYNMIIFGDNPQVMKTLMSWPDVKGCVRLVYIDPPFSTNQEFRAGVSRTSTVSASKEDQTAYQDLLVGAEYLEFLRKRLIFLKELLADDGTIYVHVDWKMGHYVKVLMDEILGQGHFINDVARIKCNPKNFERRAYGNIKDMIFVYSKTDDYIWNGSLEGYTKEQIERLFPKTDKDGRRYTTNPLHAPGETKDGPTGQPWRGMLPPKGRHWRYPPEVLEQLNRQGLVEWSKTGNPRKKIYADEYIEKKKLRQDIWEFKDPPYPSYPTEKNLEMLKVIVKASSNKGDLVLDCFAGSGTTLIAAEETGRRWIGIDNSPVAINVTLKRLFALKRYRTFKAYNATNHLLPLEHGAFARAF